MENCELYHWGIKGMKWGVRRYRNEDGTLTDAGKKRYSDDEPEQLGYKSTGLKARRARKAQRRARVAKADAAQASPALLQALKNRKNGLSATN